MKISTHAKKQNKYIEKIHKLKDEVENFVLPASRPSQRAHRQSAFQTEFEAELETEQTQDSLELGR